MTSKKRKVIRLESSCVPAGCEYDRRCQFVLLGKDCRKALEERRCDTPARAEILDGLREQQQHDSLSAKKFKGTLERGKLPPGKYL